MHDAAFVVAAARCRASYEEAVVVVVAVAVDTFVAVALAIVADASD